MSASGGMLSLFSILTVVADSRTHTGDKQYRTYTPQTHTHTHTHTHTYTMYQEMYTQIIPGNYVSVLAVIKYYSIAKYYIGRNRQSLQRSLSTVSYNCM